MVQTCIVHYADPLVMPTWTAESLGGGRIRLFRVGIIRALRERRGPRWAAGSVLVWCPGVCSRQGPPFEREVGVQIDLRGLDPFMALPQGDYGRVDAGVQELHAAVCRSVWRVTFLSRRLGQLRAAMLTYFARRRSSASRLKRSPRLVGPTGRRGLRLVRRARLAQQRL
jgi:hypothetical protein